MVEIKFAVSNPFSNRWGILITKVKQFSKKAVEFNVYKTNSILAVELNFSSRRDHAGLRFDIGFLGYDVELHLYDVRHWDRETKSWELQR